MKSRFYIWVTSDCNLACPFCIQAHPMRTFAGYQMQPDEVDYIVNSCKERNIRFDTIEVTGGESSLWDHLEYGVKRFSEICDMVTLATNGNNPERIKALRLKTWIVSESQATKEQMQHYEKQRSFLTINAHKHKRMPDKPLDNVLPAICCTSVSPQGEPQWTCEYIQGKVYNCPDAYPHTAKVGILPELVCDFTDDFISKFKDKNYMQEICRYCLGNQKVWNKL